MTTKLLYMRNLKIEVDKLYKARNGRKIKIYSIGNGGEYPVHGAIETEDGNWQILVLTDGGRWYYSVFEDAPHDIVSEWTEPIDFDPSCLPQWANWIAMDEDGRWFHYFSEPEINDKFNQWESNDISGYIPNDYCPMNFSAVWKDSLFSVDELKNQK